jgi:hypothetical protein
MSHILEKVPDKPIVVLTLQEDFDFARENLEIYAEMMTLIESDHEPVVFIGNMLNVALNLNTLVSGTNFATRGIGALFHHPGVRQIVFVTASKLVDLAAAGLNSPVFGNVHVEVFPTLETALAYAAEQVSETT